MFATDCNSVFNPTRKSCLELAGISRDYIGNKTLQDQSIRDEKGRDGMN